MSPKVIMEDFTWTEISGVPKPMQEPAQPRIIKAAEPSAAALTPVVKVKGDGTMAEAMDPQTGGEQPGAGEGTTDVVADLNKKMDALAKRAERSDTLLAFTGDERAHYDGLDAAGQAAFLGKSKDERALDLAKAEAENSDSDPVAFTDSNGRVYRKSAGAEVIELAKRYDVLERRTVAQDAALERLQVSKEAEELFPNLPGEPDALADLLEVVKTIPDDGRRDKVLAVLKAHNDGMAVSWIEGGRRQSMAKAQTSMLPPGEAELDELVEKIRNENPGLSKGRAMAKALDTPAGQELFLQTRQN